MRATLWSQWIVRVGVVCGVWSLSLLTGCAGFFVPVSSTSTSTTTTVISGDYVYAVNPTTNTLSGYAVGSASLTAVSGSPYALVSTASPTSICISGTNAFLYVGGVGGIYGYSIASTGVLTAISSGAQLGSSPIAQMACSPDGNWIVGLDNSLQQIDEYQINTSTGVLTAEAATSLTYASNSTFSNGMIGFSPLDGYVVAALGNSGVSVYSFSKSNGALSYQYNVAPSSSQVSFNAVGVNSTDTTLYIAETNGILAYTITSNPPAVLNSTPIAAGTDPSSIVFNSDSDFMYVGNLGNKVQQTAGTISEYAFSGGVPSLLAGSPVGSTGYVQTMVRDNSGNYLLAGLGGTEQDLALYSFSNSTSGTLNTTPTTTNTSTAATGSGLLIAATH